MFFSHSFQNKVERIFLIAKHDYLLRYYGSYFGILWAFLNPFFRILIYYVAFSFIILQKSDPQYILHIFLGILMFQFFTETTAKSFNSFRSKGYLIENIGISKYEVFTAEFCSVMLSFLVNMLIYMLFSSFFNISYSFHTLYVIILFITLFILSYGTMLILATINIFYKDFDHLWDIVILGLFWILPIVWKIDGIIQQYHILTFNPLCSIMINIQNVMIYDS